VPVVGLRGPGMVVWCSTEPLPGVALHVQHASLPSFGAVLCCPSLLSSRPGTRRPDAVVATRLFSPTAACLLGTWVYWACTAVHCCLAVWVVVQPTRNATEACSQHLACSSLAAMPFGSCGVCAQARWLAFSL
jgi:hypothetical protein